MAKHLHITGVVQRVGYRAGFESQARALGLSGWVRNRSDGSVEAMISGSDNALSQIIEWAWRGPFMARVRHITVTDTDEAGIREGIFERLPTV